MKDVKDKVNEGLMMIVVEKNENQIRTGKCWAAVNGNSVVAIVSMRVPKDIAMDTYRAHALESLQAFGEVISGEVVNNEGQKVFCKRLAHKNRSQNSQAVRAPKIYHFLK